MDSVEIRVSNHIDEGVDERRLAHPRLPHQQNCQGVPEEYLEWEGSHLLVVSLGSPFTRPAGLAERVSTVYCVYGYPPLVLGR